jgi:acetyl esterase
MNEVLMRPDTRSYLDAVAAQGRPPMNDQTVALIRQLPPEVIDSMLQTFELPVGELGEIRDVAMPGPGGEIALKLFDVRRDRGASPVVVFYHGGGFTIGSISTHAPLAAEISRQLDLPVVSVEYRLAPEHKWPAAPDDAEAAARWIAESGALFGREFTGLVLCGDSAGGALTLITALALRDRPAALPVVLQIAIYPVTDRSVPYTSASAFGDGYGLNSPEISYFDEAYSSDKDHWRASPLLAELSGLPPLVLATAGLDPLRDEGRAFASKAALAGVDTIYREYSGTIHGCFTYRRAIPSAQDDFVGLLGLAREMLGRA